MAPVIATSRLRPATRCAPSPITDVPVMIASDVPTARRMGSARKIASVGTMRNPPPTPKNPVIAPMTTPAKRSRAGRSGGQEGSLGGVPSVAFPLAPGGDRRQEHHHREPGDEGVAADGVAERGARDHAGSAAVVNAPACRQQTRPSRRG